MTINIDIYFYIFDAIIHRGSRYPTKVGTSKPTNLMKKLTLILGLLVVVAFSSCSKEKDCKCVTSTTGMQDVTTTMTIKNGKCSDGNSTTTSGGLTVTTTCTEQ